MTPLQRAGRKVAAVMLRAASRLAQPFSDRTARRLKRSAAKRDPFGRSSPGAFRIPDRDYALYLDRQARLRQAEDVAGRVGRMSEGPRISIVVAVAGSDPGHLAAMVASVRAQTYPHWDLCMAVDAATANSDTLRRAATDDPRLRIVDGAGSGASALNAAIAQATGRFIAPVGQDDLVDRDVLLLIAERIVAAPDAAVIYTDQDRVNAEGHRFDPHFKPDWNRELLFGLDYVDRLTVFSTDVIARTGGFRDGFEGAGQHDLLLRCLPHIADSQIHHIPRVLYSARMAPEPVRSNATARAVADHLSAVAGHPVAVSDGPFPASCVAVWPLETEPTVVIVIPTRDRRDLIRHTVTSVQTMTAYGRYRVVIVDNGSTDPAACAWLDAISKAPDVTVLRDDQPFNYSALNNAAVEATDSDLVCLLNNDVEIISPGWLREMVSLAVRPGIGCVGAKLYYPTDTVQHAGVIIGLGGVAGHSHKHRGRSDHGYRGRLSLRQEYEAVTAACLVVRREIYRAVGGLNEADLAIAFNDVDFCLKVRAAGYRNLWTPLAELYHFESATRQTEDTPEKKARFERECAYMRETWGTETYRDPAFNPNLSRRSENFEISGPDD